MAGDLAVVTTSGGDCGGDASRLEAYLRGGPALPIGTPELAGLELVESSRLEAVELPDGWVLVARNGSVGSGGDAALVRIQDGQTLAVDFQQ